MLDAAVKALSQILSPPMRSILWRSIALALVLITVLAIGLQRLLSFLATSGEGWLAAVLGPGFQTPLNVLAWIVSIAAGLGIVFGAVLLMPAITSLVAGVFVDEVADHVEREHYPAEHPGAALPLGVAMTEGVKTAGLTILVYLIALPSCFSPAPVFSFSSSRPPGCWAGNISSSRRCVSARPRKPRRCGKKTPPPFSPRA